ncbi:hypothetical protein ATN84_12005 [Paramesorhizobium deserti]|uniref:Uncharacterized protein n=1 Tax=Paramesorhizobium deserti TaxID=1494590 RepID=A0A135HU77_9HYPH|nr:hypothetical protein [Paramesorhizobium deserti]KXF76748.1 hypothetical protein ATN84_12005 [Paramesorhizobium deserti]
MNFINDQELALRLKDNAVSSKEKYLYFILFIFITTVLSSPIVTTYLYTGNINKFDYIIDSINIISFIIGSTLCYKTNKSGDDKDFIERMICISFPVLIKSIVILLLVSMFYYTTIQIIGWRENIDESAIYDLPPAIFIILYYYWRLNASMKIAAN